MSVTKRLTDSEREMNTKTVGQLFDFSKEQYGSTWRVRRRCSMANGICIRL